MSRYPGQYDSSRPVPLDYSADRSAGLVATFMNAVYAWMCVGLALTAVIAWWAASDPRRIATIFSGGTFIVLIIAELALVWIISAAVNRINSSTATLLFLVYAGLNGLTLSVIFLVYSLGSIGLAFATTAGMFGAMSVVGYVTKKDLTSLGSFLLMGLIGIIIASVLNIFFRSPAMSWIITYAAVFIFLGLTAYDTQKLKEMAHATAGNRELAARIAIVGSLTLYLDFINLFLQILRILGSRRD